MTSPAKGMTPGKWHMTERLPCSENHAGFSIWAHFANDRDVWIADVSPVFTDDSGDPSTEGWANARAIAKLPELVEALHNANVLLSELDDGKWLPGTRRPNGFTYARAQIATLLSDIEGKGRL